MATSGLPKAAETILNTLLSSHEVTSFKLSGEGSNIVFILRMTDKLEEGAIPPLQVSHNTFRRKPPSQVLRDRKRAANHHLQLQLQNDKPRLSTTSDSVHNNDFMAEIQEKGRPSSAQYTPMSQKSTVSPCPLFTTTPDSTRARVLDNSYSESTAASPAHTAAPSFADMCDATSRDCVDTWVPDSAEVGRISDSDEDAEHISGVIQEVGYSLEDIKTYVSSVTSQTTQRQLRDKTRNVSFSKTVVDRRNSTARMYAVSEDYVFECDCHGTEADDQKGGYFFIKDSKDLTEREADVLAYVERQPPIDTGQKEFYHHHKSLERDLQAVTMAVRYHLG